MKKHRQELVGRIFDVKIILLIFFSILFTLSFYSQDVFAETSDGTVSSEQKISDTVGGFGGVLDDQDQFATSIANIGDYDNNGVDDLAVGAWLDDDDGSARGAVWILFMNADGTVSSEQKISDTAGGFGGGKVQMKYGSEGVPYAAIHEFGGIAGRGGSVSLRERRMFRDAAERSMDGIIQQVAIQSIKALKGAK